MVRDNATLITFGDVNAAVAGGLHRAADGGGELRRRLAALPRLGPEGVSAMTRDVLLKIEGLRIEGALGRDLDRDRQGHRPAAPQGRGSGPDRRERRGQIHRGPRRDGLCPRRLPDHRRHHRLRRDRPAHGLRGQEAGASGASASPMWRNRRRRASTPRAQADRPVLRGAGDPWRDVARPGREGRRRSLPQDAAARPRKHSAFATRIRSRAGSCSAR